MIDRKTSAGMSIFSSSGQISSTRKIQAAVRLFRIVIAVHNLKSAIIIV